MDKERRLAHRATRSAGACRALLAAVLCLLLALLACGCTQNSGRSTEQLASLKHTEEGAAHPSVSPEDLSAINAKETIALAKDNDLLRTTYMYDFDPFTGKRDAAVAEKSQDEESADNADEPGESSQASGQANGVSGTATYDVPLAASSAFFPFAAEVVESHFTQDSYEAFGVPLQSVATPSALEALSKGDDLVLVSSAPNDEQQAAIDASGEDIRCVPVAREALIFFARDDKADDKSRPSLSKQEIIDAYHTETSPWNAFALEHGNGSTKCFEEFSQGHSRSLDVSPRVHVYPDMVSIVGGAALTDHSLGYAFNQFYRRCASSKAMRLAEVDGMAPTWKAIRAGEYPLMFDVCVLYNANSSRAKAAENLIAWMLSPEGQQVAYSVGLQPLNPTS